MLTGIMLAILAGSIWSLSGVANSCCARFQLDIVTYLFSNVFFSLLLSTLFFVRFDTFFSRESLLLALVMIPAGALNTGGALLLQKALKTGHHGIVFLISQSALVLPFLFGVVILGEKTTLLRWLGAGIILLGMVFCALPKIRNSGIFRSSDFSWLFFSLAAFLFFGSAQSLMSLPSYWKGMRDPAGARTMLLYLGCTILMTSVVCRAKIREKLAFNKRLILLGILVSILNMLSMRVMFKALDHLAENNMASIGFSLAIASSLIGFTLYSLLIMKEKCYRFTLAGLAAILTGGILISG